MINCWRSRHPRISGIFLIFIIILLFSRFMNLEADFPLGITSSGVLYTDEGWYANAAVRHYLFGYWYLDGDFNPVIYMPVGQLLHRLSFSVFGLSLSSVRSTIVIMYIFLVILSAWLVYRRFGNTAGLLTTLIFATNYIAFAFCRLAIMEFVATFFVVSGLVVAIVLREKGRVMSLMMTSVLFGVGILTKTTMVFAIPLLFTFLGGTGEIIENVFNLWL